jgi:hypothetical protein
MFMKIDSSVTKNNTHHETYNERHFDRLSEKSLGLFRLNNQSVQIACRTWLLGHRSPSESNGSSDGEEALPFMEPEDLLQSPKSPSLSLPWVR